MAKKSKDQPKQQKKHTPQIPSSKATPNSNAKGKNLRQRQLTQFIACPKPQQQKTFQRNLQAQFQPIPKQNLHSQKQKASVPIKLKKKISKKKKAKSKAHQANGKGGVKLQRGYKFCQNCQTILNIHKYVCTECGFVHNMKKHKFDVMKNLSKGTPKIVKSIIEANEFNTIKLISSIHNDTYPTSFGFISDNNKEIVPQLQTKRSQQNELKRVKSQNPASLKLHMARGKSQSSLRINIVTSKQYKPHGNLTSTINFKPLSITQVDRLINQRSSQKYQKKYNKTRQQFSIYQSNYPITVMQAMEINKIQQSPEQYLLFGELISKKEVFNDGNQILNGFGRNIINEDNQVNQQSYEGSQNINHPKKYQNGKRDQKDETKNKVDDERVILKKIRQSNALTQKALGLENFHRFGALYQGQTVINIMKASKNSKSSEDVSKNKQSKISQPIPDKPNRRSSGRLSKTQTLKDGTQNSQRQTLQGNKDRCQENQYEIIKVGLKQHVEMIKSIKNKVAVLTGKKSILLMNLNLSGHQSLPSQFTDNPSSSFDEILWLTSTDFNQQPHKQVIVSNKKQPQPKKHLTKISLSHSDIPSSSDDQFIVIEWLKLFSQYKSNLKDNNHKCVSYLATGTLHGYIVVYSVSPDNQYTTYRTIIGAHFELVNCIKECPLNYGGIALFASASFDGSVKIWDLAHKATICQFQVSNRKIQQIHWDSGAKFLIVVRDQGLENCYLACFYSVNNRVELPIMLTDTIDFRMIRNGVLFENSCSPLIAFPLNSKLIVMLNAKNGFFKIFETEEMRKTSLKRKKSKKNYLQQIYHDYWIRFNNNKTTKTNEITDFPKQMEVIVKNNDPYQIIKMLANVNPGIYAKLGLTTIQEIDQQQISQNALSAVEQSESANSQGYISEVFEKRQQNVKSKQTKDKKVIQKAQVQVLNVESVGVRKSLRARKPVIQYNFIEEEQAEQQKAKKPSSRKQVNKRKSCSDSEQFFDDEDVSSESQGQQSDKSFHQTNKNNKASNKKQQNNEKAAKNMKNKASRGKSKPGDSKTQKIAQISVSKQLRKQQQWQKQQGIDPQQVLYKLFWQQTNEESLANQKQGYPSNRFPKFSSIVSFVSTSQSPDKQRNSQGKNDQNSQVKNDEKGKKAQKARPQKGCQKSKSNKQREKMDGQEIQEDEQSQVQQQDESSNNSQRSSQSYEQGTKKNKITQKIPNPKPKQPIQASTQFLTTFIAGYSGQLIKIKIRIQGFQKNPQNQLSN